MKKLTIAIPVYEMHGIGVQMLERSLEVLELQTFTDFEVVISDSSEDNKIKNSLADYDLDIHYYKNTRPKTIGGNTNNALLHAQGELIKILFQDDMLATADSLKEIAENFNDMWLFTASDNNLEPFYSADRNTLGSPSALTIRNDKPLLFDQELKWVVDLEYYRRMFAFYGHPKILNRVGVKIGIGDWQETKRLSDELKEQEHARLTANYP